MIAMAIDANQKVLPIAFAVVDKESGPSWGWFLECLRTSIERVIPNKDICIISDRLKVSNAPFESGLEGNTEENGYIIDIAFDMLLATSTRTLITWL